MTSGQKKAVSAAILLLIGAMAVIGIHPVAADQSLLKDQEGFDEIGAVFGGEPEDIRITVAKMINIALTFIGVIFVALAVFAGFQYMTSAGNEEKTKKSVDLLRSAIIGLLIILAAWSITRFSIVIMQKTFNNTVDYTRY